MKYLVAGTSGVGKTYLERWCCTHKGFVPLKRYTNRPKRPTEENDMFSYFCTSVEFEEIRMADAFHYILSYAGNSYAWKKSDVQCVQNTSVILPITLEHLEEAMDFFPDYIPFLLVVEPSSFPLLEHRMHQRGESADSIKNRLSLAAKEYQLFQTLKPLVLQHHGNIFTIEDDTSLHQKVIPFIG